ncbi:hypothetical protein ACIQZB_34140 [Streptomyces sp. NPDC097727]
MEQINNEIRVKERSLDRASALTGYAHQLRALPTDSRASLALQ